MLCRLTKRTSVGTAVADPSAVISRLADYEDTGYAPEEFARVRDNVSELADIGVDLERLKTLALADKEERLVVRDPLPSRCCAKCKYFCQSRNKLRPLWSGYCEAPGRNYSHIANMRLSCRSFVPRGDEPRKFSDRC